MDRIDERNDRKAGAPDENLYRYARRGEGVHAYVIDTGVRGTHSEFTGRMGVGFYIEGGSTTDTYGHGTHVAGTIAGSTYGIAKAAMIHPVRVSQDGYWSASEAIECIEWIINQHASTELAVANMSFRWYPSNPRYDDPIGFETAINSLIADGVVVVCAAGNEYGTNIDYDPCYPAAFPVVITVGATDSADARASFSNIGTLVDVWAPGVGVLSAGITNDSASASMSGTSMAAPHVAGVAARFLQVCPTYTHTQIRDHIVNIASVGKITGDLGGSENKLLFMNGWFYPFHKLGEWENSDLPYSDQWVYIPEMSSWVWSAPDWYPWFWVDSIQDWYHLQTDTPFLTFFHYPPSGWPPAIVWYQE